MVVGIVNNEEGEPVEDTLIYVESKYIRISIA